VDAGLIGGMIGGGLDMVGGAIGTYCGIKNTLGPRERRLMVKVSLISWVAITVFLVGLMMLPKPYNILLWAPYGVALALGIRWCNQRQLNIRTEEAAARASGSVKSQKGAIGRRLTMRWSGPWQVFEHALVT
jgi:hypothetical protein